MRSELRSMIFSVYRYQIVLAPFIQESSFPLSNTSSAPLLSQYENVQNKYVFWAQGFEMRDKKEDNFKTSIWNLNKTFWNNPYFLEEIPTHIR